MFRIKIPFLLAVTSIARLEAVPDLTGFVEHFCIDCHGDGMEKAVSISGKF